MEIFRYTKAMWAVDMLTNRELRLSSPDKCNDPFDSQVGVFAEDEEMRVAAESGQGAIRWACFCKNPESVLMWAHYGDSHTGILVGFDGGNKVFEGQKQDVEYSDERPPTTREAITKAGGLINATVNATFRKTKKWEYEQEVRYWPDCEHQRVRFLNGQPFWFAKFEKEAISSITFGLNVCDSVKQTIRQIWEKEPVYTANLKLWEIVRTQEKFGIERVEVESRPKAINIYSKEAMFRVAIDLALDNDA